MKLLITGDFFVSEHFKNQSLIDDSIKKLFSSADFRIANLEAPLTANEPKHRIVKTGPYLRSSGDATLPFLKQLEIDAVTLANNHIMDYGLKGLNDTFNILKNNRIKYVGAGLNLREATKELCLVKNGIKIALINFAENEWASAADGKSGANPMDIIDNVTHIRQAKVKNDLVIVIIHGGHEFYHFPSPRMVKQYRFFAENGADAVIGHHTHCLGGYEVHKEVPIFYGLGNFLFTRPNKNLAWYQGLTIQLQIKKEKITGWEAIPVKQDPKTFHLSLPLKKEKDAILNQIQKINQTISDPKELNNKFRELSNLKQNYYIEPLSIVSAIPIKDTRKFLLRKGFGPTFTRKQQVAAMLHFIRCESHRDLLHEALKKFIRKF